VFRFDVRLKRDQESERLADWLAEARERRMLLVDSDASRRIAFAEQGRAWGIKVRVVTDGEAALPLLRAGGFDLLLVQQDAQGAATLLRAATQQRCAVLVPSGATPRLELATPGASLLWLSAPLRSRTLLDALLGREVASLDVADLISVQAGDRPRVLVIEDSEANRLVMSAQLDRLGCVVDAVETGSEAIRLASQRRYALVLADLGLPDMSGLDVAAAIRKLGDERSKVPIVAVTGGVHPQDRERCLAAGMNAYMTKPLARQDLARLLERYLPSRTQQVKAWDPGVIEEMAESFGLSRGVDLLAAFQRELGQRLGRIRDLGDLTQIGNEAHALKSAALSFGAEPLGDVARELEDHCREGRRTEVKTTAHRLLVLGQATMRAIHGWLEQHRIAS
jgi:CheY-like chemotaxis protein/HPt (histidine-containing phosphotransfer) domain-containing protein